MLVRAGKSGVATKYLANPNHYSVTSTIMNPRIKLLVVDDDPALRQLLADYLNKHDYDTLIAPDATDLDAKIQRFNPALIVLDRMMPGIDGLDACKRLRDRGEDIPIILLTAKDTIQEKIAGLKAGADDYLGKPFDPRELLARIEAILRRKQGPSSLQQDQSVSFGRFVFDYATRQLTQDNEIVKLTGGEINLLEALIKNSGKALSRERLLLLARDDENGERNDRAIDIAILRLRRVIEVDPKQPRWIQTVWGTGYRFSP
jgi:two-component system phosphate regulon response regulator OmpR